MRLRISLTYGRTPSTEIPRGKMARSHMSPSSSSGRNSLPSAVNTKKVPTSRTPAAATGMSGRRTHERSAGEYGRRSPRTRGVSRYDDERRAFDQVLHHRRHGGLHELVAAVVRPHLDAGGQQLLGLVDFLLHGLDDLPGVLPFAHPDDAADDVVFVVAAEEPQTKRAA